MNKKKSKLLKLQKDLRNGLTLEEALTKHQISFKDAVTQMPKPLTPKQWSKRK